jgi:hypothetical protein
MTASLMISENTALAARYQVERMTGIEPALSAWNLANPFELYSLSSSSDRPRVPGRCRVSPVLMAH